VGRDPVIAERLARCGFDEITVDLEHAPVEATDLPALTLAIVAGGAVPLVRLLSRDTAAVGRVLDMGAAGVIAPQVEDEEAVATLVAACRYPPAGVRSSGPIRARYVLGTDEPSGLEAVLKVATIESAAGLEHVEAIAAAPGLDALYVGPADLALGLGLAPAGRRSEPEQAVLEAALDRIVSACRSAGLVAGLHCPDGASAAAAIERGFRWMTVTSDIGLAMAGGAAELLRAQGGSSAGAAGGAAGGAASR
jgi:4-hydroxy-2-oxoheptanedioate aldolase